MTRLEAARELHRLAGGLPVDDGGVQRLLERIAASDHGEELRGALLELGARALLDQAAP